MSTRQQIEDWQATKLEREMRVFAIRGPLSDEERVELERCEAAIKAGFLGWYEAGLAAGVIRDKRLYRSGEAGYESIHGWRDYCGRRWGCTHRRMNQLIDGAKRCKKALEKHLQNLNETGTIVPKSALALAITGMNGESCWRELAGLETDDCLKVVQAAADSRPEGKLVRAEDVRAARRSLGLPSDRQRKGLPKPSPADAKLQTRGAAVSDSKPAEWLDEQQAGFKACARTVRELRKQFTALTTSPAGSWLRSTFDKPGEPQDRIRQALSTLAECLRTARPERTCPVCGGHGCGQCSKLGWRRTGE